MWVVATIIVVAFLTKTSSNFSRIWVTTWLTSSLTILVFARIALWYQIQRWRRTGILTSNLVILGTRDHCEDFVRRVRVENDESFHCLGILLADKEDEIDAGELTNIDGIPVLGKLADCPLSAGFVFR